MTLLPGEIVVDSFAGGGGASLGIQRALGRSPDIAINHDVEAMLLHAANHPDSRYYRENVWQVDPVKACDGRPVGLMWLSPDCKHFSKAKGGKPVSKKIRGLAWVAVRWAQAVAPRIIVLENVEEFQTWGPVRADGRPCPERKGKTFRAFVRKLERLGYRVEWRQLRACDYGAPTIRKRLFIIARRDGQPIKWPMPTHGKGRPLPWRTAAECIDWSIACPSIFLSKAEARELRIIRPLKPKTLRRIARGIQRFVIEAQRPFIVSYYGPKSANGDRVADVTQPLPTIPTENRFGLVVPYIAGVGGRMGQTLERPVDRPFQTVTSKGDAAVIAPLMIPRYGEWPNHPARGQRLDAPMPTIVPTQNGASLVAAFLAKHYGDRGQRPGSGLDEPVSTITQSDHHALVTSNLIKLKGTARDGQQIDLPLHTVQSGGLHYAEVRAFLCAYYGTNQNTGDLSEPLPAVTSRDRFALVTVDGQDYAIADIGMRMLQPRELYRAQGFPDSYVIAVQYTNAKGKLTWLSKTAQVKMCGNSVPPDLAEAIVSANIGVAPAERVA